jgi:hypothetical protein
MQSLAKLSDGVGRVTAAYSSARTELINVRLAEAKEEQQPIRTTAQARIGHQHQFVGLLRTRKLYIKTIVNLSVARILRR